MQSPDVQGFVRELPGADVFAIREVYDLAARHFADIQDVSFDYRFSHNPDTDRPILFLTIDTNGMDTTRVVEREIALFDDISSRSNLLKLIQDHIVTVV